MDARRGREERGGPADLAQAVADAVPHPPELPARKARTSTTACPSGRRTRARRGRAGTRSYRRRKEREVSHWRMPSARAGGDGQVDQEVHGAPPKQA